MSMLLDANLVRRIKQTLRRLAQYDIQKQPQLIQLRRAPRY
jgi:hypothetical protein